MKKLLVAVLLGGLLLTGCGSNVAKEGETATLSEENVKTEAGADGQNADGAAEAGADGQNAETEAAAVSSVFSELPDEFIYSSGAGGWATKLYLNDDGTFTGQYQDSDLGYTGEGYPNGTVYISNFTGKFTEPQVVNEYTYSMTVESIELEMEAGQEYYEDGKRYVVLGFSELTDSCELLVYLPGAMRSDLPEGFVSWARYGDIDPEGEFRGYGIYNPEKEIAFIGYRFTDFAELQKLTGTFRNESGDEFVIDIYQDSETLVDEIGSVYWTPNGGETEYGHLYKDAEGGFRICLPESREYCFKMTDNDVNHTQFAGVGYSEELGTFTKVQ